MLTSKEINKVFADSGGADSQERLINLKKLIPNLSNMQMKFINTQEI